VAAINDLSAGMLLAVSASMRIQACGLSIAGRRAENQDAVCLRPDLGLFVVADGMGGYEGGEIASRIAVSSIEELVGRSAQDNATWPYAADLAVGPVENEVMIATRLAGERISAGRRGRLAQMGSTVVVLRLVGGKAVFGHVGDSRLYRLRAGRLEQMTVDHSLWAELVAAGSAPTSWEEFPYKNVVTRALGTPMARADVRGVDLVAGDVYLLCSDGLTEGLGIERMAELLRLEDVDAACETLVSEAFAGGSRDNISALVVKVA
jgi:serine/threonine protein phosphatase PrpC